MLTGPEAPGGRSIRPRCFWPEIPRYRSPSQFSNPKERSVLLLAERHEPARVLKAAGQHHCLAGIFHWRTRCDGPPCRPGHRRPRLTLQPLDLHAHALGLNHAQIGSPSARAWPVQAPDPGYARLRGRSEALILPPRWQTRLLAFCLSSAGCDNSRNHPSDPVCHRKHICAATAGGEGRPQNSGSTGLIVVGVILALFARFVRYGVQAGPVVGALNRSATKLA